MKRREFSFTLARGSLLLIAGSASGCGTLLHPERHGQPHSNQLDWKVVALDSLGLILFFVPGVIAFVVDFSTGAIYLPYEEAYPVYAPPPGPPPQYQPAPILPPAAAPQAQVQPRLRRVPMAPGQLHPRGIEQAVAAHTSHRVQLTDDQARLSHLASIDEFHRQVDRHRTDRTFGEKVHAFFARVLPA